MPSSPAANNASQEGDEVPPLCNDRLAKSEGTITWSTRLLSRVKSVVLSPYLDDGVPELDMMTRLRQYKAALAASLVEHNAQSHQYAMDLSRMETDWDVRVRKLACRGTSRQNVEHHRFLHHIFIQELRLAIDVEECVAQILTTRCSECEALIDLATSSPSTVDDVVDSVFFKPPSQLIATHPEYIMLHSRQERMASVVALAREVAYPSRHEDLPLQTFASSAEHAAFSVHLEAFRRGVSTTQSATGRLLRQWHVKLRHDIERIVVPEPSSASGSAPLDSTTCPLIPPSRIFRPNGCTSQASCASAIVAIDIARLPSPHVIAAFESFLVRRVSQDLMLQDLEKDARECFHAMLRVAVHHAVFATMAPLVSAYEDCAVYTHLSHMKHLDATNRPLLPPLLCNSNNADDEAWTPARLPQTLQALVCMCAETTPLGILAEMLVAIRCLHDEVAPYIPSINADILIPLLLHVLCMQLDILPTIYRRLHAAVTFSSAYVHDGAEVVYYLTCVQAAVSHLYASTVGTCDRCAAVQKGSIMWRDLGAPDDASSNNQVEAGRPASDKEAIAELSAWLKQHTVSDSTISIVSNESWML